MTIFRIHRVTERDVEDPGFVRYWQEDVELRHTSRDPMPWKDKPEQVAGWLAAGHDILPDGRVTDVYHETWFFVELTALEELLHLMHFYGHKLVLDEDDPDYYDVPPIANYSGYEILIHDDYMY